MEKYKILEANYSTLWESSKATTKATFDSSASTIKGCSTCSNIDINALKTNHARLEEKIKSKDKKITRLNMLITQGNNGAKSIPKVLTSKDLGTTRTIRSMVEWWSKGMRSPCGTREATSTPSWILPMESPPLPQQRTSQRLWTPQKDMVGLIIHPRHRRMWWNTSPLPTTLVIML
jgi:hypothetical protein